MDNNFNLDENTMNKLNSVIKGGNVSDLISQIPPDVLANFSSMMNNNSNNTNDNPNNNTDKTENNINTNNDSNNTDNTNGNNNSSFNFNNIDMNTILKMKSIIDKMNNSNDPRSNLLASLKPYLRDNKKQKLDEYANLLNFAKIAEILNNDNKEPK